jgi:hypothetical protein
MCALEEIASGLSEKEALRQAFFQSESARIAKLVGAELGGSTHIKRQITFQRRRDFGVNHG